MASNERSEKELLSELFALYAEVDARLSEASCPASSECCRFGRTRREPYLTSLEIAALAKAKSAGQPAKRERPPPLSLPMFQAVADEGLCPFLGADARCTVYAARPFGCRTFFCERATVPFPLPHKEMLAFVRRLKELSAVHQPRGDEGRPLRSVVASLNGAPRAQRRR